MATQAIQRTQPFSENQNSTFVGSITNFWYSENSIGVAVVDTRDAAVLLSLGWTNAPWAADTGPPVTGVVTLQFGAFPGSNSTSVSFRAPSPPDVNSQINAWVIPVATADHTADEHIADPPRVSAALVGGNVVISGYPSGRDLPVPAGTPFGGAPSQQPIGNQQAMPYDAWSVAWSFSL